MDIAFTKMHGAGNDFILVDDRNCTFPIDDSEWLQRVGARKTGVGCDGFILVQPPEQGGHFRMRFINPDGGEVEMCGNGARCVAKFAQDLGICDDEMRIETVAGLVEAEFIDHLVRLRMTPPADWRMGLDLSIDGADEVDFVNSGVPHAVVRVDDIEATDICGLGSMIRYHEAFAPAGTNANFIQVQADGLIRIRTYERGVEDETLACGTGMCAAALIAGRNAWVTPPVRLTCRSGDELTVDFRLTTDGAEHLTLLGPAMTVFSGSIAHTPRTQ